MTQNGIGWWLEQVGRVPLLTPAQEIALGNRVQSWLNHEDGPDDAPVAVRRSGQRAKDQFVAANLRLAVSYVTKHCGRLVRLGYQDDLVQAANLGVIRAVEKYDPSRGYRFSTYAYWWIRQSVNRWVDQHSRMISIPGSHSQLVAKIESTRRRLGAVLSREPSREELAAEVGIDVEQLEALVSRARSHLSLDQSAEEDGGDLSLFVGAVDVDPAETEQRELLAARLVELMECLAPQQKRIVAARYGLNGPETPSSEIAAEERITTRQVERILRESLSAMCLARRGLGPKPTSFPSEARSFEQLTLFRAVASRPKPKPDGGPKPPLRRRREPVDTPALPFVERTDLGGAASSGNRRVSDRYSRGESRDPSRGKRRDATP